MTRLSGGVSGIKTEMHLCGSRFINSADEESVSDYEGDSRLSVEDCERHESHRQTSQQSGGTVMGDAEEVYRRTFVPRLIEEDSVDQFESIVETLQLVTKKKTFFELAKICALLISFYD